MDNLFRDFRFTRTSDNVLVAEASDLGYAAGVNVPGTIHIQGADGLATYRKFSTDLEDGEVVGWTYRSAGRSKLVIFND